MKKTKKILLICLGLVLIVMIQFLVSTNVSNAATKTKTEKIVETNNSKKTKAKTKTTIKKNIASKRSTIVVNTNPRQYTGEKIKPTVKIYRGEKKLKLGRDYTVKYINNKNIGKATIKIKGIGEYKGTIKKKFYIIPKKPTLYTVKVYEYNKAKIHWQKDKKADGYKIYMSTSKNGEYTRIKTITDKDTTRYIKSNLDPDTTYYFKIVSYKDVNGKRIYSKHSNKIKKDLPSKLLAEVKLTSYTSGPNRNTNLRVASRAVNGTILKPGERFVWSRIVGPATHAKGYKDAIVFANKKHVLGTGGGICQVSTTVYQTAKKCNLKIIERHQHSLPVSYTTRGNDATVSHGVQNLIFQNNKSYSIRIEMTSSGGSTMCKMYRM